MQITFESLSGLERKLNIVVPSDDVEGKVKVQLHKVASKAKIPGFRPGKIPFDMVQKQYSGAVRADVLENLIRETYAEAIKQEKLNPASPPTIKITSSKPNEQFEYSATFEIYPEVKLNDLKLIEVEKQVALVVDADVDAMLENMRKNHVKWQEVTDTARKSQVGDQLTIDFTAKPCVVAGAADNDVKSKTEKDVKFVLGDGFMWADFEQPLYGVSFGEEKKYILQLPTTHTDKDLAGNRVEFNVKVHKICEPILPALDDGFAEKMHIPGGLTALRDEVRKHMERELKATLQKLFKDTVMDKLLDCNPIEVPKALVEDELARLEERWQKHFGSHGSTPEKTPVFPRNDFEKQAKANVSLGLLLSAIVKEHQLTVEPQEVRKKIEDLTSIYDDGDSVANKFLSDRQRLSEIESILLEEKVIDYLASQVKLTEKTISYKEAVAKRGK